MLLMDAIFTVANFFVFAAFVFYIGKTKIIPMVKAHIAASKQGQQNLVDQTISASAEYRSLQEKLEQQDDLYTNLDKKVQRWQRTLDQNYERACEQQKKQAACMEMYCNKQQEFLEASHKAKLVMPLVIEDTRSALQQHFAEKKFRDGYDTKTINHMARLVP